MTVKLNFSLMLKEVGSLVDVTSDSSVADSMFGGPFVVVSLVVITSDSL